MVSLNLESLSCVEKFIVDGGYIGDKFANSIKELCDADMEVVKRNDILSRFCQNVGLLNVLLDGLKNIVDFGKIVKENFTHPYK